MAELTKDNVKFLVVHASATPPDMDIGARAIDRWHRERGWLRIGYHVVVTRSGQVEKGRPLDMPGAHVLYHNHHSVGICLIGGVDAKGNPEMNFTDAQMQTLRWTLDALLKTFHKAKVVGHRDFEGVYKSCPCFNATEWYYNSTGS